VVLQYAEISIIRHTCYAGLFTNSGMWSTPIDVLHRQSVNSSYQNIPMLQRCSKNCMIWNECCINIVIYPRCVWMLIFFARHNCWRLTLIHVLILTVNKSAQSNFGRGPCHGAVAYVHRRVPIGYNGVPEICPQKYLFLWTDLQTPLPASSLDPSNL